MPNHCTNTWNLYGTEEDLKEIRYVMTEEVGTNEMTQKRHVTFNKLIPMPEILKRVVSGSRYIDGERVKLWTYDGERDRDGKHDRKLTDEEMAELSSIGPEAETDGWYGWSCKHWGMKWDAYDSEVNLLDGELTLRFDTAWGAPEPVAAAIRERWPEVELTGGWRIEGYEGCGYV